MFSKIKEYCVSARYETAPVEVRSLLPTWQIPYGEIGKPLNLPSRSNQGWVMPTTVPQLIKPDYFKYPRRKLLWYPLILCIVFYYHYPYLQLFLLRRFRKQFFLGLPLNRRSLRLGCHLASSIDALCCQPGSCRRVCQMVVRVMRCLDTLEILMAICLSLAFRWERVVNIWLLKQKILFKTLPWSEHTACWSHLP